MWQNIPAYLSEAIERVQKRALNIIYPEAESYAHALQLGKLDRLDDRRVLLCYKYMPKIKSPSHPLHHLLPSPLLWGVTISRFPYPVLPPPVRFCPFVSRLPPFIVFLPLSCKSRCLTPYSDSNIGSALALSKIKNCVVNRTTPHFPARSLKRHSFDTSLHHAAKSSLQFPC